MEQEVIFSVEFDTYTEVMAYIEAISKEYSENEIMWDEEVVYNEMKDKYIITIIAYEDR